MRYHVQIKRTAAKQLARIDLVPRHRIEAAIVGLASRPRPPAARSLVGAEGYRLRIGDYRVVYTVADSVRVVSIVAVGHRRDIYRRSH